METAAKIQSFEDLECWKIGRNISRKVSEVVKRFPKDEKYGLTDQLKRSSRSLTNNIAEGYGRFHFQENIQFCRISRGSAYEVLDQLLEAYDEKYIEQKELDETRKLIDKFLKVLNGYINYLGRAKREF